jgi:23S rRNA (uracil1939-C5)-methyltransferase
MHTETELTFFEMAPGGDAVGRRDDGLVVFVPGGAPGDRALVALPPPKKGHARGRLLRVLKPGEARVQPACPLANPEHCGGCPLMAVSRPAQLQAKEDWVRRALRPEKLGHAVQILPILDAAPALGYRLRARLVVRNGQLGFAGARSHRGVRIDTCAVLVPALDRVLFSGPKSCARLAPLLGEGATVRGLVSDSGEVQLAVELSAGAQGRAARAALQELVQSREIVGVHYKHGPHDEWLGEPLLKLDEKGEGGGFFATAAGFAQPSRAGHTLLPRLVAEALPTAEPMGRGLRVLELYSGSGNLTRALCNQKNVGQNNVESIHCIEGDVQAAARAQRLFRNIAAPAVTIEARPVETALLSLVQKGARFDAIVLDPPRTGAREALGAIVRLGARRIVYVSCDPMTLGRDLAELSGHGYRTLSVQPIDLVPHAAHVECVAIVEPS